MLSRQNIVEFQMSKKYTLEEIINLELNFGTQRKNQKLGRSLEPRGLNQIIVGTDRRHVL